MGKSNNGNYLPGNQWTTFKAIFYKTTKFDVIQEGQFWLSSTSNVPSYSFNGKEKRNCDYALFQEKATGIQFYIFNTHFSHIDEYTRIESAKLVRDSICKIRGPFLNTLCFDLVVEKYYYTFSWHRRTESTYSLLFILRLESSNG